MAQIQSNNPNDSDQESVPMTEAVFDWLVQEYIIYPKSGWWYLASGLMLLMAVLWTVFDQNYPFAIFLVLFYLVAILYDIRSPKTVEFVITPDGIKIGSDFYFYREIRQFYIIYQQNGIKNIYFEFTNPLRNRLIIPLDDQDPIVIREFLLQFIEEDLEQEAEPISERLRRWMRL